MSSQWFGNNINLRISSTNTKKIIDEMAGFIGSWGYWTL